MQNALVGATVTKEGNGHPSQVSQLGGEARADRQGYAGSYHAVSAQHALAHVGDVHRSALSLVGARGPAEQFGHHQLGVHPFSDAVTMPPVGAADVVILSQVSADSRGYGLLPCRRMDRTRHTALACFRDTTFLKMADGCHSFVQIQQHIPIKFHNSSPWPDSRH